MNAYYKRSVEHPPNDWRISCKRLARPAPTYVPQPASGGGVTRNSLRTRLSAACAG